MKKLTALTLVTILLVFAIAPAYAAVPETAVPFYTNTSHASISLTIDENGNAGWGIICLGYSHTTGIDAVTYLERELAGTWVRVFIGNGNDEFTYSTSASRMSETNEIALRNHGTYRAVVEFTIYSETETETITLSSIRDY